MTGQQLKNSILQLAIQGKLVPQIESEGTAEDLLKEIRAEKERLVKEGKLKKKDLEVKPIEEDEVPFEIPEGWRWCRWGDLSFSIQYGYNAPAQSSGPIKMVRISDIHENKVSWETVPYCEISNSEIENYKLQSNDILFARTGGTVGKSFLVTEIKEDAVYAGYLIRTRFSKSIYPKYAKIFMETVTYWEQLREGTIATAQPNCNGQTLSKMKIPLPPLSEQRRIVSKIEELMPLVEEYGKAQERLEALNKELPEKLKKSVLQEAIMGKLVPQDPKEGTAEELLAEIRKEKEKLVKEGKLKKKDLEIKPIEDDEIPFEIPEGWRWCRLGEISTYALSKKKINASEADPQTWGLDLEDIEKGGRLLCIKTVGERGSIGDKTIFSAGDILYSKLRPYLLKILVAPQNGICTSEIVPFSCYGNIENLYMVNFLKSPYVDEYINSTTFGIKMPRVSTETMNSLLVPLPPHDEQKRIVKKVEEVMKEIEGVKK